jgi:hypothetical protein
VVLAAPVSRAVPVAPPFRCPSEAARRSAVLTEMAARGLSLSPADARKRSDRSFGGEPDFAGLRAVAFDFARTLTQGGLMTEQTWTAVVEWRQGEIEEVDVTAATEDEARGKVLAALGADYQPGWRINSLDPHEPELQVWSL